MGYIRCQLTCNTAIGALVAIAFSDVFLEIRTEPIVRLPLSVNEVDVFRPPELSLVVRRSVGAGTHRKHLPFFAGA
jgi:hypothetical protein